MVAKVDKSSSDAAGKNASPAVGSKSFGDTGSEEGSFCRGHRRRGCCLMVR